MSIYEGGAGGKLRRQAFRRSSPYDRHPTVGSGSGWLAKLVDPASRFIAVRASRMFSSLFRKEFKRLPDVEGSGKNSSQHMQKIVDIAPSESQIQEATKDDNLTKKIASNGISEIEQLLKNKKLTRAQIDYLTKLLCSRTIESTGQASARSNEGTHVSEEGTMVQNSSFKENLAASGNALNIFQGVTASPAEIAKAYMSSKLPKTFSAMNLKRQGEAQLDKSSANFVTPFTEKPHDHLSIAPQSALLLSSDVPKPRGKTAIYRMSRSPFFKAGQPGNVGECFVPDNAVGSSSLWTPGNNSNSDGRQLLKRGSTFLDSEYGSIGPIRRIRQKTSLISANNARASSQISSHSLPLLHLDEDCMMEPTSSQKPQLSDEFTYADSGLQNAESGDSKIIYSNIPSVCGQLNEESRKEKTNLKSIAIDEQPLKLTADMLNVQALSSMKNVDSSQILSINANVKERAIVKDCQSEMIDAAFGEEIVSSGIYIPGVKDVKATMFNKTSAPSISFAETTKTIPLWKPAFQMTAPEDYFDLDDEEDALDASTQPNVKVVQSVPKIEETKAFASVISAPEQPSLFLSSSSNSMRVSTSLSMDQINNKANDKSHDSKRVDSFSFPVTAESSGFSLKSGEPNAGASSNEDLPSKRQQTLAPEIKSVESSDRKIQPEKPNLFNGRMNEVESLHKSSAAVSLPEISTLVSTDAFTFGASSTSSQSDVSVFSFSSPSLVSASTAALFSSSQANFSPSDSKLKNSTFTFGAVSTPALVSSDSEGNNSSKSPFASFNPTTTHVASSFSSTGNDSTLMTSSLFHGSRSTCSVETMPEGVSTLGRSSSSLPAFSSSYSASTFGSNSSSSQGYVQVPFGPTIERAKPFGSTSGFSFSSGIPASSTTGLPFSSGVGLSSASSTFPFPSVTTALTSSSTLSFSTGSSTSNPFSSSNPAVKTFSQAPTGMFGGSSSSMSPSSSSSSISTPLFGSLPSTEFSFGLSSSIPSASSFGFGSSSRPAFPFSSTAGAFSSVSQNSDQMNVEDTMTDDTNQAPLFPPFGQSSSTPSSNFAFGSAAPPVGTSAFHFGTQQNPPTVQNPNPYQASSNLEFAAGGSFSLGSGGGDKSMRKTVKIRRDRDKIRRK